jgi:hypothetical protein
MSFHAHTVAIIFSQYGTSAGSMLTTDSSLVSSSCNLVIRSQHTPEFALQGYHEQRENTAPKHGRLHDYQSRYARYQVGEWLGLGD